MLHDVDEAAIAARARADPATGLARRAARLDLDAESTDEWVAGRLAGLRGAPTPRAVGAEAEVVIEAALEDLDLKRDDLPGARRRQRAGRILATNTSALSVAARSPRRRPGRSACSGCTSSIRRR